MIEFKIMSEEQSRLELYKIAVDMADKVSQEEVL